MVENNMLTTVGVTWKQRPEMTITIVNRIRLADTGVMWGASSDDSSRDAVLLGDAPLSKRFYFLNR